MNLIRAVDAFQDNVQAEGREKLEKDNPNTGLLIACGGRNKEGMHARVVLIGDERDLVFSLVQAIQEQPAIKRALERALLVNEDYSKFKQMSEEERNAKLKEMAQKTSSEDCGTCPAKDMCQEVCSDLNKDGEKKTIAEIFGLKKEGDSLRSKLELTKRLVAIMESYKGTLPEKISAHIPALKDAIKRMEPLNEIMNKKA